MIKSFKTRIYPTSEQIKYFRKAFGVRRWTWNWAWSEYQKQSASQFELQKKLNNGLVKAAGYEWLSEVNSMVRQESIKDLSQAIKAWHNKSLKTSKKPHYASRKTTPLSFRLSSKGAPLKYVSPHYVSMTRVRGKKPMHIKCAESMAWLSQASKVCQTTIKEQAGKFYIVITYEAKAKPHRVKSNRGAAGIDMGIKIPLVVYDDNDEAYAITIKEELRKAERRTEVLQRALSRKQEARKKCSKHLKRNSKRYEALKLRLQRAYAHEANIKRNWREQMSWWLISRYDVIAIEPYSTKAADNLNCSRAARRAGGYEFCERLKRKAEEYGTVIKEISWEPTTQTCSHCGHVRKGVDKVTLQERTYVCPHCGFECNRDVNAARNIYELIFTAHGRWV